MLYDPTEFDRDQANELAFENAIEDILTGDIHLVPDVFLFNQIHKRMDQNKWNALSQIPIVDLHERRSTNLFG